MIRTKCPICSKPIEIAGINELPTFPFCSERCRLADLGRWLDSAYVIPAKPATDVEDDGQEGTSIADMDEEAEST